MEENLNIFLKESRYCDINSPIVYKKAFDITKDFNNDKDKAIALFYWVRNNIKYKFGLWNKRASDILIDKNGMCTNKAVLLTSLFRSIGIPSGFGILYVKGQNYFGPIAPKILSSHVSKKSVHIYSYVFLYGHWYKVDPSVDPDLSIKSYYFNPTTELTEWRGDHDATENLNPEDIIDDVGPLHDIDQKLDKKPRKSTKILLFFGNLYIDFIRDNKYKITNPDVQLEYLFKKWLRKKKFIYYILFNLYFFIKNDY